MNPKATKLPPPRPVSDPTIELPLEYVEQMKVRAPGCIEARLMRDWLRMYRQLNPSVPRAPAVDLFNPCDFAHGATIVHHKLRTEYRVVVADYRGIASLLDLATNKQEKWNACNNRRFVLKIQCAHKRLNEDGICRACGSDCRGGGA